MKDISLEWKLLGTLFILLIAIHFTGCSPKTQAERISEMQKPIKVVGVGTNDHWGEPPCMVLLRANNGEYEQIYSTSVCSMKVGDVLE